MAQNFDDRDGQIWLDGAFVPWREAKIHVLTHGLHYGSAVFEGERAYNGKIFRSADHTARLLHSAQTLGMAIPFTADQIEAAKTACLAANKLTNAYIRPIAWRGSEQLGVSAQATRIRLAIACWDWPSYFSPELRAKGIRLVTSRWARPAPNTAPVTAKAAGLYMICTISKHEAEAQGAQDALMHDYRGFLAEATGANLFLVIDGQIHTPTPDCFLNGLTRQTVIDLAKARGMTVVERHIKPEELGQAQEIFLTGTAAEITPVGQIDNHHFTPAAITQQLIADYTALVNK